MDEVRPNRLFDTDVKGGPRLRRSVPFCRSSTAAGVLRTLPLTTPSTKKHSLRLLERQSLRRLL